MKPRAVIFDLFGTLVTFSPGAYAEVEAEMARILTAPGYEFSELWTRVMLDPGGGQGTIEENLRYVLRTLGTYTHLDQERRAIDLFYRFEMDLLEPDPAVTEVLTSLRAAGLRTGLISNTVPVIARLWPACRLATLIDAAVFASEAGLRKPHPGIFAMAAERLAMPPARCLYVGDGDDGELEGARAAGMRAVWLRPGRRSGLEWPGDAVDSLEEIAAFIA